MIKRILTCGGVAAAALLAPRTFTLIGVTFLSAALPRGFAAARVTSDLPPPQKRQLAVGSAERLAQRKPLPALPSGFESPFNPPGFDRPERAETPAPVASGPVRPVAPPGARETLEKLAGQLVPSGTIQRGGTQRLLIGGKAFEVGTRFTATYNSEDYELELVAIDRTTYTLRYRGEEITRPIKPVR